MGPEPLTVGFNPEYLAPIAAKAQAHQTLILDQTVIAGLGNIYADELLGFSWNFCLHV